MVGERGRSDGLALDKAHSLPAVTAIVHEVAALGNGWALAQAEPADAVCRNTPVGDRQGAMCAACGSAVEGRAVGIDADVDRRSYDDQELDRQCSNRHIAQLLSVTEGTVRYHRRRQASGAADGRSGQQPVAARFHAVIDAYVSARREESLPWMPWSGSLRWD